MASQGPNNGTTFSSSASDPAGSTIAWVVPSNAATSNDIYTTTTTFALDDVSRYLLCSDYGFSIPGGSTIDGIVVEIERKCDTASALWDYSIRLIKGGTVQGDDKAALALWGTSDAYASFGGTNILWGLSWSTSDINASDFGVAVSCQDAGVGSGEQGFIDHVRITVYYTAAATKQLALLGVG